MTADNLAEEQPIGRRERKLQQTRSSLTRSALDLFSERGFDAVTVVDIADRSDVDPSTFFRHFRSKESLLFTDMDNYVATIRPLLDERPADEPLIESLRAVSLRLGDSFDFELLGTQRTYKVCRTLREVMTMLRRRPQLVHFELEPRPSRHHHDMFGAYLFFQSAWHHSRTG